MVALSVNHSAITDADIVHAEDVLSIRVTVDLPEGRAIPLMFHKGVQI